MNNHPIRFSFLLLLFLFILGSCHQEDKKQITDTYKTGKIENMQGFFRYNKMEKQMDSLLNDFDSRSQIDKKDFKNNRARIFMDNYTNESDGFPAPCDCYLHHDTVTVKMGIGFFGGMGFLIHISGNRYDASYFEYTDDNKPYKASLTDPEFSNHVIARGKSGALFMEEAPGFRTEQQLTGLLEFESDNFYIRRGISPESLVDSMSVTGKIYFTCKTRMKTAWD